MKERKEIKEKEQQIGGVGRGRIRNQERIVKKKGNGRKKESPRSGKEDE